MQTMNFHTHTKYSDGRDTPREMIEQAIALGFTALGFSDHSYAPNLASYSMSPEGTVRYYAELRSLADEYRDRIRVYAGIEQDAESFLPDQDYDFCLSSVHEMVRRGNSLPIDSGKEIQRQLVDELFGGSFLDFCRAYYERLADHVSRMKTDVVGHIDLVTKYSLAPEDDPRYRELAAEAVREIVKWCPTFELNTGAIARGLRKTPYPAGFLLDEIRARCGRMIVSSDCHDRTKLACWFDEAEELLRAHGFTRDDGASLNDRVTGVTVWS